MEPSRIGQSYSAQIMVLTQLQTETLDTAVLKWHNAAGSYRAVGGMLTHLLVLCGMGRCEHYELSCPFMWCHCFGPAENVAKVR